MCFSSPLGLYFDQSDCTLYRRYSHVYAYCRHTYQPAILRCYMQPAAVYSLPLHPLSLALLLNYLLNLAILS